MRRVVIDEVKSVEIQLGQWVGQGGFSGIVSKPYKTTGRV